MSRVSLGHSITVTCVDTQSDTDCRLNIKKRHERAICRSISSSDRVNIAYLAGDECTPAANLFISDRSTSIPQNRLPSYLQSTVATTGSLSLHTEKFLLTDVFTDETATQEATPLYYAHTLLEFNPSNSDWGVNKTLVSIQFLDENFQSVAVSEYYVDLTTGKIYNNLSNSYSSSSGTYTVYFIQYTVKIVAGSTTSSTTYHELLNNSPAFHQATFEDLDETGMLDTEARAYLIELSLSGDSYIVTLPTLTTYAWKELPGSRLKLLPSAALDLSSPWYIKAQNGKITASLLSDINRFSYYRYGIAEFNAQGFSPYSPYKLVQDQKAVWLSKKLVYVPQGPVVDSSIGLHIDLYVYNTARTLLTAYTTNTTKIGTAYTSSVDYETGISSYDTTTGFIELTYDVAEGSVVLVQYYIAEDKYEFTSIDFNPTNNLDILQERAAVYVIPETSGTGELTRSLYYLLVDPLGRITYCSQAHENATGLDPVTQKLLAEDFNSDGTPKHTLYYDRSSTEDGLTARVSGIHSSYIDDFSFIDKYTTESVLFQRAVTSSGTLSGALYLNLLDNPHILMLGDICVGGHQGPEDLTVYDIRTQGGGIKEDDVDTAIALQPEVGWYWDIGKEIPYPAGGSIYVEVPKSIHVNYGGDFTDDQIRNIVEKHMTAGGYAVIDKYGIDPVITSTAAASGLITFTWPTYGVGQQYNVYYAPSPSNFILTSGSPITDVGSSNTTTISGLKLLTKYYVYVAGINSGGDDEEGPVVAITTTQ